MYVCVFVVFGFRHKPENSFAEHVSAAVTARVSAAVSARVSNGIFVRTTFHNFQLEVSKWGNVVLMVASPHKIN